MDIAFDNLPQSVRASIDEDLSEVRRLGGPCGIAVPEVTVRLVALQCQGAPDQLPAHDVPIPGTDVPISFHDRCDWETQRQSFHIVEDGGLWVIGGGAKGVLHGFGELLQRLTGVIWGGLTDEDVLFGEARPLPVGVQSPRFAYRCRDGSPSSGSFENFIKWLSRNKYNAKVFTSRGRAGKSPEEVRKLTDFLNSRCMHQIVGYHCMEFWMPDEQLERDPEWRGLRDGQRVMRAHVTIPDCPNLSSELPIQPCYSNRDAAELIVSRMAEHVNAHPEIEVFSIWPHDGVNNWCQCPDCLKKTPYEQMYDLALQLLPHIPETVPIELIAYSNLLNPPFQPLAYCDRIISMLCPYLRPFHHRIYDEGGPAELVTGNLYPEPDRINPADEREYGELFRRWGEVWAECGSVPAIFEYGGTFPDETRREDGPRYLYSPAPQLRHDEARWYAERGVRYFYLCSIYKGWPDPFLELDFAASMWGGEEPVEAFEERYYRALIGDKGPELCSALRALAEKLRAQVDCEDEMGAFENVVEQISPSPARDRYRLWAEYVKLGRPAREHELAGDYERAAEQETKVQAFFDAHHDELIGHINAPWMRHLSETFEQRFRERLTGESGRDYKL